jgi:hypothetical protein
LIFGQFPLCLTDIWLELQELVELIRRGLYRLRQSAHIINVPDTHDYISPDTERVAENYPEGHIDDIIAQCTQIEQEEDTE